MCQLCKVLLRAFYFLTCDKDLHFILRKVLQAHFQYETSIQPPVFVRPSNILGYPENILSRVSPPHFGLHEAENHWFYTYHRYYLSDLNMHSSIYGPCLVHTEKLVAIKQKNITFREVLLVFKQMILYALAMMRLWSMMQP